MQPCGVCLPLLRSESMCQQQQEQQKFFHVRCSQTCFEFSFLVPLLTLLANSRNTANRYYGFRGRAADASVSRAGKGMRRHQSHLLRNAVDLQGMGHHFQGLAGKRRSNYGGGQNSVSYPGLSGFRKAVATQEWNREPAFASGSIQSKLFKRFPCAIGHRVVLGGHGVNVCASRSAEAQPARDRLKGAGLRPASLHDFQVNFRRFSLLCPLSAELGGVGFRRALNVQDRSTFGK